MSEHMWRCTREDVSVALRWRLVSQVVPIVPDMWLLDSSCSVCHAPANGICGSCVDALADPVVPPLLGFARTTVLCSYEGVGADLVRSIKYRNRRQGLSALITALSTSLTREVDAIVPVPAQPTRRRERGYHVPDLMAARLSKRLKVPVVQPLVRVDDGSQQGRDRTQRQAVEFRASGVVPERVLLVDDVVTTGATAVACGITLGLAGSRYVEFVALAATPPAVRSERVPKGLVSPIQ